jgi:hypothetical protein
MAAGTLFIAIMIAIAASALAGSGLPNPPPGGLAPKGGHGAGVHGEHHPVMNNAIEQLARVKQMLTKDTESETAGHRAQAILLIDQAIEQLKEGVAQAKH